MVSTCKALTEATGGRNSLELLQAVGRYDWNGILVGLGVLRMVEYAMW
jgi:hypothetical protein